MDAIKIGKRLKDLRGEKTTQEVADETGIGRSALAMYECGKRIPRDDAKFKLAEYFGKTVDEIFFSK